MTNFTIRTSTCLHLQLQAYITFPMFPNGAYGFILQNKWSLENVSDLV
jgi:hypothetical protein